jgi:RNA polymerase sigma-70 factor (ECF subfamily)
MTALPASQRITQLLQQLTSGDPSAEPDLVGELYVELRSIAQAFTRGRQHQTLHATALINEAYVKLLGSDRPWESRTHFYAVAARAMRQVLADHARRKQALKRQGDARRVTLHSGVIQQEMSTEELDVEELDAALSELARLNERHARVVELRFLAGLTIAETAEVLGVSHGTIESDWRMSRAWLRRRLGGPEA